QKGEHFGRRGLLSRIYPSLVLADQSDQQIEHSIFRRRAIVFALLHEFLDRGEQTLILPLAARLPRLNLMQEPVILRVDRWRFVVAHGQFGFSPNVRPSLLFGLAMLARGRVLVSPGSRSYFWVDHGRRHSFQSPLSYSL